MNGMRRLLAVTIVAALMLPGLALAAKFPPVVGDMVKAARSEVNTTDMAGYKQVVDNPGNALLIDVREESEYAAGHIPGTVHVPRGLLEFKVWPLVGFPDNIALDRPIYVQCLTGGRASLAAKTMKDLGFTNVTAVVMNLGDWQQAGYPLVQ